MSLPSLSNRELIVVDRDIKLTSHYYDVEWCIEGKKTYEQFCDVFTELHISHIDNNYVGNVTFPDFSNLNPKCEIFNYKF